MSRIEQTCRRRASTITLMAQGIHILTADRDGEDGVIVTFSDGTTGGYVVEELLALRPFRERIETDKTQVALVDKDSR